MRVVRYTVLQIADRVRDEADAYLFLEELRWKGTAVCAHCASENVRYLKPANGKSRATSGGASMSQRRVWQCRDCRRQFSVTTGTVMHGSKISLRIWVLCMFEMVSSKNGIAAREIERKYGVCPRTAWHVLHRIREAMATDFADPMEGEVIVDETYFGGADKNRHARDRKGIPGVHGKTAVLTLIDKRKGEARSRVMAEVTGASLLKVMADQVNMSGSHLVTDKHRAYGPVGKQFLLHTAVDHDAGEYVAPNGRTTNHAEGFFSQLKRSVDGTHHRVSDVHLQRYLHEFDFRYSTRDLSDTARMQRLLGQVGGKRLTYKLIVS